MAYASIRPLREDDYPHVIGRLDAWWGGRAMVPMLPRLFFEDFAETSLVAERDGEIVGFLVGYDSPGRQAISHVHFVGVAPAWRGEGLGARLYERFIDEARDRGRRRVVAVTSPSNVSSRRFHAAIGFVERPVPGAPARDPGAHTWVAWDGPGEDRIRLELDLGARR